MILSKNPSAHQFLVGIVFILFLSSCGDDVKYFRKIISDGKLGYQGLYPVNKGEVPSLNCYKLTYDGGKISTVVYLKNGKMTMNEEKGFARMTFKYWDNVVLISLENQFSLPVLFDGVYSYQQYSIDKNGFADRLAFLDKNYHPVVIDYTWFVKLETDIKGRIEKSWYFDDKGHRVKDENAGFGYQEVFDDHNRVIKGINLDQDGKMMMNKFDFAYVTYEYDDSGNQTSISYFDMNNKLVGAIDGMATTRWKYDQAGNKIETIYYDRFNNIVNATQDVAINTFVFDKAGNCISQQYYDSLRKPASFGGYTKLNWFYDNNGLCKKVAYFKVAENDSIYLDHAAKLIYDPGQNLAEVRYIDASMNLDKKNDIAVESYRYDGAHNMISYKTYDADQKLKPFDANIAQIEWAYNLKGEKIQARYYDVNANLAGGSQHVAINRYEYDTCGWVKERSYFDSLDRLVEYEGAAIIKYQRDIKGILVDEIRLDKTGKPAKEEIKSSSL